MVVARDANEYVFRLYQPHAACVELIGGFTGWEDGVVAMRRERDGWWTVRMRVPAGDHEFVYVVNGDARVADYAANGVKRNRDGQWVSLLSVSEDDGATSVLADASYGSATAELVSVSHLDARGAGERMAPGRDAAEGEPYSGHDGAGRDRGLGLKDDDASFFGGVRRVLGKVAGGEEHAT